MQAGEKLRAEIFAHGGAKHPTAMLEAVLGRPASMKPMLDEMQI